MCGINGILRLRPDAAPISRDELLRTRDHMEARGPDGAGEWFAKGGEIALAHRRLAIIDLSPTGSQPMSWAGERYWIVFNGEIYNYREIRADLLRRGVTLRSCSDTEVILALYALEGERGFRHLRGMFAFALWDEAERRLLLGRDPNGIKPLYYANDGRHLRFASQARALLSGGRVAGAVDPAGLCGFLCWGSVPEPLTLWKAIRAVPAGTLIVAQPGISTERRQLPQFDAPAADSLAAAVEESVVAHLVSDVPVAVFLSAGIDSAMIAALACRHLSDPPLTVTLRFEEFAGSADDEAPEAAALARLLGTRHVEGTVTRQGFLADWPSILDGMDQPSIDGINTWLVCKAAREAGVKCALSGLGGDELLGSYSSFRQAPSLAARVAWLKAVPGLSAVWPGIARLARGRHPKAVGLLRYGTSLPGAYYLRRALFLPEELPALVGREFADAGLAAYDPVTDARQAMNGESDAWRAVGRLETRLYMRNQLLRDSDWASMAHSIELRVPLVDTALQQQAWSLAHEPARSQGKAAVLRSILADGLPSVLGRPKSGFSVPVATWLDGAGARPAGISSRHLALRVANHFGVDTAPLGAGELPRAWRSSHGARSMSSPGKSSALVLPLQARPSERNAVSGPALATRSLGRDKVLLATLAFGGGGVNTMAKFAASLLREGGFEPVVASYKAYSVDPTASVPVWALPFRRPRASSYTGADGLEIHEIGARLPELEFLHEYPNRHWRALVTDCRHHIAVVGTAIGSMPFYALGIPHLVWAATPWGEERASRRGDIGVARRVIDATINGPMCGLLERRIVRQGRTVALSQYTRDSLNRLASGTFVRHTLAVPPEEALFSPAPGQNIAGRVGFVGRLGDSRKNVWLLLDALALCRKRGLVVHGCLVGGKLTGEVKAALSALDLSDVVTVVPFLERSRVPELLRTFDLYVLPSRQEGLCIAALEAMACGIPIVSTRCGGPEEFVEDGVNGFLVGHSAEEMASRIAEIVSDRSLRNRLGRGSEDRIRATYTRARCAAAFWAAFDEQFGERQ